MRKCLYFDKGYPQAQWAKEHSDGFEALAETLEKGIEELISPVGRQYTGCYKGFFHPKGLFDIFLPLTSISALALDPDSQIIYWRITPPLQGECCLSQKPRQDSRINGIDRPYTQTY